MMARPTTANEREDRPLQDRAVSMFFTLGLWPELVGNLAVSFAMRSSLIF
jgi:hypothetical protein